MNMAKKAQKTKSREVVKCICSTCRQIANAQPNSAHQFCQGIDKDIIARFPGKLRNLKNPNRMGTWTPIEEPVLLTG